MASDAASLDAEFHEALKQRNELLKRHNAALQSIAIVEEGRLRSLEAGPPPLPPAASDMPLPPQPALPMLPPSVPESPLQAQASGPPLPFPAAGAPMPPGQPRLLEMIYRYVYNDYSVPDTFDDVVKQVVRNQDVKNRNAGKLKPEEKRDKEESEEHKRFRIVVNRWNTDSQKFEDSEPEPLKDDGTKKEYITYRRHLDSENERKCIDEECDIPAGGLKDLLQQTMTHVESESIESVTFASPFPDIVYNWSALEKASVPQESDEGQLRDARSDLKSLLDNVRISEPRKLKTYFKDRESHARAKTITFGTLWTLFKPGTKVLAKPFMDEWQMFEVQTNWSYRNPSDMGEPDGSPGFDKYRFFKLLCAGFDWDGKHFRRYTYHFEFEKFEGRRPISGLQCFPVEYWSAETSRMEVDKLKEQLIERGEKFSRLCTAKKEDYLCKYAGFLLQGLPPRFYRDTNVRTIRREIKNKSVIVDNLWFMQSRRNNLIDWYKNPPLGDNAWLESADCCPCKMCRDGPIQSWSGNEFEDLEKEREDFAKDPERLLLCPPKVLGYVPTERIWAQFSVKRLERIEPEQKEKDKLCFEEKLVLDQKHKDMLLALVRNHASRKETGVSSGVVEDPIDGKGRGLAILLHGPPGVGKTLTAEAVALATGRPLLPVSVAELGIEPSAAETSLLDVFADASRWDAVMVIDEADVFLEERIGTTDISRNALVSVLLRVLEYYDGIIILTTNRITSLDVAVQSRMHLAIQYKDLTPGQKKNIFMKFLDDMPNDQIRDRERIERELDWFCKGTDLNGRQIRNIVSSAQALAKSERKQMTHNHLSTVYDATSNFVQSLKDLTLQKRGRNEAPR